MEWNFYNVRHNQNHFTLDSHGGTSHVQHPTTTIVHEDPFRGSVGKASMDASLVSFATHLVKGLKTFTQAE